MVTLKNERVEVQISEMGAEIRKMTLDGNDVMWSGDPAVWSGVAPIMFPICGGFKTDEYTFEGRQYTMQKHGFARTTAFTVEESGYGYATLLLTADDGTRAQYPWDFELRVTYRLHGTALDVTFRVDNCSETTMLFAIGSHEGYATPEGIEEYDVIFPEKETLRAYALEGNLLKHEATTLMKDGNVFPLYEKYFEVDALVFKDLKSRSVTLRHRPTGREITIDFPEKDYFLMWHKYMSRYICLEPWGGIPSYVDEEQDLAKKEGMRRLPAGESYTVTHTIRL